MARLIEYAGRLTLGLAFGCRASKPVSLSAAPSAAGEAGSAIQPSARGPERFTLVDDSPCPAATRVEDLSTSTLLVSPVRVRLLAPGQALSEAVDLSDGLPAGRGTSTLFATNPVILRIEVRPRANGMEKWVPHRLFRLADGRWIEERTDFGGDPRAIPVDGGVVVVGWFDDPVHGDPGGVPIGNQTRAWRIASDGSVSPVRAWPNVMSWDERSTGGVLWAVVAKPARPGKFVMRLPLDGRPQLFPIPGVSRCRGDDRLTRLAELGAVTNDGAQLVVEGYDRCVPNSAAGQYHLRAADGRWVRDGPAPPEEERPPGPEPLRAGGRTFSPIVGAVLVTEGAATERYAIANLRPPVPTTGGNAELFATLGGREIWATVRDAERCRLYRY